MTVDVLALRIFDLFDDATRLLAKRLSNVAVPIRYKNDDEKENVFVRLALVLLAFACYIASETMRVLIRSNVTLQLPTLVRHQFEAAICASYIVVVNPKKARDFILLDDFERFDLTLESDLNETRKKEIEDECRDTLAMFPEIVRRLKNGSDIAAGKLPIDRKTLKEVRKKLDFPDVRAMMHALEKHNAGFSGELYTLVFRFGSLTAHPNIVSLRRIFKGWNGEERVSPLMDLREPASPDFTLQGLNYVIGLGLMLDSAFEVPAAEREEWSKIRTRHESLAFELKATDRAERTPSREPRAQSNQPLPD